jgi:restriction endonuclease S subunit
MDKVRLDAVALLSKGTTITAKNSVPGDIPVIAGGKKPAYYHNEANRKPKCVTVSASGAYAGFVAYHHEPIFASDCTTVEPLDSNVLSPKYLYYFLASQQDAIYALQRGSGMPHVYAKDLAQLEIPLPSLWEQQRIVDSLEDHLSRLDKALAGVKESERKTDAIKGSLLEKYLFDTFEVAETKVKDLGKWVTGATPPSSNPLFRGTDVPFVTPGDICYGGAITTVSRSVSELGADRVRRVPGPSMQLVCIGATLGKVGWSENSVTTNQQVTSLIPGEGVTDVRYATYLFSSPSIQSALWGASSSTTVPILNKGTLEQMSVAIPPISEQCVAVNAIDSHFEMLEKARLAIVHTISLIEKTRVSLLHQAFMKGFD